MLFTKMKIRYDKDADAMYIKIRDGKIDRTKKIDDNTLLDVDKDGNLLGIELLFVKERNPNFLKEFKSEIIMVS